MLAQICSRRKPGECKHVMMKYLDCMKRVKGVNENECRMLAKSYLSCRMERWVTPWRYHAPALVPGPLCQKLTGSVCSNLMARDELKNLGFAEEASKGGENATEEKGVKGELRW